MHFATLSGLSPFFFKQWHDVKFPSNQKFIGGHLFSLKKIYPWLNAGHKVRPYLLKLNHKVSPVTIPFFLRIKSRRAEANL